MALWSRWIVWIQGKTTLCQSRLNEQQKYRSVRRAKSCKLIVLNTKQKDMMECFFKENSNVFVWSTTEMPGISPFVICHFLNVNPTVRPIKQKKRKFTSDRVKALKQETDKFLKANFIRKVYYLDWFSNVVMVKKACGKWRMCVDFIDLNKVCPKNNFPLPSINKLVDASTRHHVISEGNRG